MIKISILIPIYNVENYIRDCLDSVFEQDLSEDEYEVICVNDGSTDNSRDVVLEYAVNHSNILLIDHPCNLKLGLARNTGRKYAKGKYIWYVDADDKIEENCLGHLFDYAEEKAVDVLEFGYSHWWSDDKIISNNGLQVQRAQDTLSGPGYLLKFHGGSIDGICGIWRKIYSKRFLDENDIFSPPINMGEDVPFAITVFGKSKRITYYDRNCYFYRRNSLSLTGLSRHNWGAEKWYESSIICSKYMNCAFEDVNEKFSHEANYILEQMIRHNILLWSFFQMPKDTETMFWQLCRQHFINNLFVFKYLNFKQTIEYLLHLLR